MSDKMHCELAVFSPQHQKWNLQPAGLFATFALGVAGVAQEFP